VSRSRATGSKDQDQKDNIFYFLVQSYNRPISSLIDLVTHGRTKDPASAGFFLFDWLPMLSEYFLVEICIRTLYMHYFTIDPPFIFHYVMEDEWRINGFLMNI
jgi:hypothetical protein